MSTKNVEFRNKKFQSFTCLCKYNCITSVLSLKRNKIYFFIFMIGRYNIKYVIFYKCFILCKILYNVFSNYFIKKTYLS